MEYITTEVIKVNNQWLKWARKTLKYTKKEVSTKLNKKVEDVEQWEKTGELSYNELKKISQLYDVSSLFFLNNTPPSEIIDEIVDFRTIKNKKTNNTPEILKEIKHAKYRRKLILDLQKQLELTNKYKYDNICTTSEECIETIKKRFDINNIKLNYSFEKWIKLFESYNILIFQFYRIPTTSIRGYALHYDELPIIGINHSDSDKAKTFTLFHELAHILLKEDGISGSLTKENITQKTEQKCNKIAAEILLPEKQLDQILEGKEEYSLKNIVQILQSKYNISKTAIVYRLLNLNKISKEECEKYITALQVHDTTRKSKNKRVNTKNIPNKKYKDKSTMTMNKNGTIYINTLFQAEDENIIDDITLAQELNIPRKAVPFLVEKIREGNTNE